MNRFIAYFDILGYKKFLENCTHLKIKGWIESIFIHVENSLANGAMTTDKYGRKIADLSSSKINSTIFSDTIVFWTDDDSESSFIDLLEASYWFNWQMNLYSFPIRGYINYGEIGILKGSPTAKYGVNSVYGKEALNTYYMSESMEWAGTVIDNNVVDFINLKNNFEKLTKDKVIQYSVPFRISSTTREYKNVPCLRLVKDNGKPNKKAFDNLKKSIKDNFLNHDKESFKIDSVKRKYDNTINFLKYLLIDQYK